MLLTSQNASHVKLGSRLAKALIAKLPIRYSLHKEEARTAFSISFIYTASILYYLRRREINLILPRAVRIVSTIQPMHLHMGKIPKKVEAMLRRNRRLTLNLMSKSISLFVQMSFTVTQITVDGLHLCPAEPSLHLGDCCSWVIQKMNCPIQSEEMRVVFW